MKNREIYAHVGSHNNVDLNEWIEETATMPTKMMRNLIMTRVNAENRLIKHFVGFPSYKSRSQMYRRKTKWKRTHNTSSYRFHKLLLCVGFFPSFQVNCFPEISASEISCLSFSFILFIHSIVLCHSLHHHIFIPILFNRCVLAIIHDLLSSITCINVTVVAGCFILYFSSVYREFINWEGKDVIEVNSIFLFPMQNNSDSFSFHFCCYHIREPTECPLRSACCCRYCEWFLLFNIQTTVESSTLSPNVDGKKAFHFWMRSFLGVVFSSFFSLTIATVEIESFVLCNGFNGMSFTNLTKYRLHYSVNKFNRHPHSRPFD